MRKENLIARERRMTSPETTSNLSRSKMSRKHTTWDLLRKRPMREMRPKRNGNAARNLGSNVVTGTFLLNKRYASILFDTDADRSFVSTAFSSLIDY
uniref:Reverse transcriptase domain-containing protein n=1 Tax=Tanacetum cinerariifolium TaxID=118510 RepID=A0A699TZW9_TANCI|nr:reverse transcriptase domain-containing protein [Tanacetum cinerariifolium]